MKIDCYRIHAIFLKYPVINPNYCSITIQTINYLQVAIAIFSLRIEYWRTSRCMRILPLSIVSYSWWIFSSSSLHPCTTSLLQLKSTAACPWKISPYSNYIGNDKRKDLPFRRVTFLDEFPGSYYVGGEVLQWKLNSFGWWAVDLIVCFTFGSIVITASTTAVTAAATFAPVARANTTTMQFSWI